MTRDPFGALVKLVPKGGRAALGVLEAGDRPGQAFEESWRASLKRRVVTVVVLMAVWACALEARFVHLQVFQHAFLLNEAELRQNRTLVDKAKRGEIVDRNGQILAYSVDADTVFAVPTAIKNPAATAAALCGAFGDCAAGEQASLAEKFSEKKAFMWVRRRVSPEDAARVAALKLEGVGLRQETRRFYPKKELAAHVLGFVNTDSVGLGGVESAYNSKISGVDGVSLVQVDAHGRSVQSRVEQPSTPGATIELTIDQYVQHIAERELAAGVEKFHAEGGTAIVMDPRTGEILAEASYPTFNPNFPTQVSSDDDRKNRAIQDIYEPGSTFKIVTASAAFEEGVFKVDDMIDTNPGRISIPGRSRPIGEDKGRNHGVLSFEDVVVESSNVGAVKIGLKVGAERMERYINRFGFGQIVGKELAGESRGQLAPLSQLTESSLASMSMGYEVGVTPLQMVTAVSAVANGGTLFQPHVIRAVVKNGVRTSVVPKAVRQSINENTAATLTTIMEGVVERGTAKLAKLDGYQVAGKTGTAAKVVNGRYSTSDYNVSFVGFVPSRQPRLAILVLIDTPHNGSAYGGIVAAPIWKNIAEATLRQLGVPRTINPVPPLLITSAATAINAPTVNAPIVPIVTEASGESTVPDVHGLSVREALRVLGRAGLTTRVAGDGVVTSQMPEAGAPLERGAVISLQLKRAGAAPSRAGAGR
jgi:cell division protein FtsI/penicillin-binding protein 2